MGVPVRVGGPCRACLALPRGSPSSCPDTATPAHLPGLTDPEVPWWPSAPCSHASARLACSGDFSVCVLCLPAPFLLSTATTRGHASLLAPIPLAAWAGIRACLTDQASAREGALRAGACHLSSVTVPSAWLWVEP